MYTYFNMGGKMKKLSKSIIICVAALMILNIASAGYAQDMGKKLHRGAVNLVTGWMEIPNTIRDTTAEDNMFTGITLGIPKGCCMAIIRTAFGFYEIVTFLIPLPEGYNPMLEPEFVVKGNS